MKKFLVAFLPLLLGTTTAFATEQETIEHCARIIRDFREMPESSIPRSVLNHSRGLAIITVLKAGFIFSGKLGHGVVVARMPNGH